MADCVQVLDVRENPNLVMPPKPVDRAAEWYNIDFSLQNQLRLAGASPATVAAAGGGVWLGFLLHTAYLAGWGLMCVCVGVSRCKPPRSPGEEDEAEAEEGLFSGRPGQAGAEGHDGRGPGEEELGGRDELQMEEEVSRVGLWCFDRLNVCFLQENGDLKYGDLKIRRWDKSLEKPQLDYSEYYMEDIGQVTCL